MENLDFLFLLENQKICSAGPGYILSILPPLLEPTLLHTLMYHGVAEKMRSQLEAAGGGEGGWAARGCSLHKAQLPQALLALCSLAVAALPAGFHFVPRSQVVSRWNSQAPGPSLPPL